MSVENSSVIDLISTKDNIVTLTISDHLEWDAENHFELLEAKLNSYIDVLDNQSIYELYPDSVGKELAIRVVFKYKPDKEGEKFLNSISEIFETLPYNFSYYTL
ncbi:DUF6572 domain-containing protein [Chryseobacterium cheonjiense]|uniref:Uncharacterized protein n=1 Tax=Chryseobacterium cheonjiense TaxID=2728845 RepID=A0A7Y0A4T3_9FLAO|nr:DUF6572 domain-containing protein [Chryseobacterium cheonjiense]NML56733.1 hypothetical protein [Chryseobacterium cheonjiense]